MSAVVFQNGLATSLSKKWYYCFFVVLLFLFICSSFLLRICEIALSALGAALGPQAGCVGFQLSLSQVLDSCPSLDSEVVDRSSSCHGLGIEQSARKSPSNVVLLCLATGTCLSKKDGSYSHQAMEKYGLVVIH